MPRSRAVFHMPRWAAQTRAAEEGTTGAKGNPPGRGFVGANRGGARPPRGASKNSPHETSSQQ
eukprot:9892198-Alexandrium_andersonii.AAC.1